MEIGKNNPCIIPHTRNASVYPCQIPTKNNVKNIAKF